VNSDYESIFYVGSGGFTAAASGTAQSVYVGDRSNFLAAQNRKDFISGVTTSRISGNLIIIFSSPVIDADNKFIGLVGGSLKKTILPLTLVIGSKKYTAGMNGPKSINGLSSGKLRRKKYLRTCIKLFIH
jgi:hypothetical protein